MLFLQFDKTPYLGVHQTGSRPDTYRAVYTVRFADVIYVLHAFQKKSTRGIQTAKADIAMIRARLRLAYLDHAERTK